VSEPIRLKSVDSAIQKTLLSVDVQPPLNPRRRYYSEGKRRVKRLQGKPMTLNVRCLFSFKHHLNLSSSVIQTEKLRFESFGIPLASC
jgi:hypothetical protein